MNKSSAVGDQLNPFLISGLSDVTGNIENLETLGRSEDIQDNPPFLLPLKQLYKQTPSGLFKELDLKENIKYTILDDVIGDKEYNPLTLTMKNIMKDLINQGKTKDEVIYHIKQFDNFVTSWVWQNMPDENNEYLSEKASYCLDLAKKLEKIALEDEYFVDKKLFPNVDFYSGIILEAMNFPTSMFTPIFALSRTVGWISQWKEMIADPQVKIGRPRQLYLGEVPRDYTDIEKR